MKKVFIIFFSLIVGFNSLEIKAGEYGANLVCTKKSCPQGCKTNALGISYCPQ